MGTRGGNKEQWWVGFLGTSAVTEENAAALLDNFFPNDGTEINIVLPDNIGRSNKGLKVVQSWLKAEKLDYELVPTQDVVNTTLHRRDDPAYLIVLWKEDEEVDDEFVELVERALSKGVEVRNLCDALDEVVIDNSEEEEEPRQHGKPRAGDATMDIQGAATIAPQAFGSSSADILLNAIRSIIREEVSNMGLSIGHNTFQSDADEQDVKIKAYVSGDGEYELAPEGRSKAPRGSKTVTLTKAEAKEVGLPV